MGMSFNVLGLTFHLYGFIVGIAVSLGILQAEYLARKTQLSEKTFWRSVTCVVILGIIGARLYHVFTDWHLYRNQLWLVPLVWHGGLSIIGSFFSGAVGVLLAVFLERKNNPSSQRLLWKFADIAVVSLPFSQAVGRVANYVNQELYGLPSSLPWAIPIDPSYRVTGYTSFTHFHPLFVYEAIGMTVCGVILWLLYLKKVWAIGSNNFFLFYLSWYGILRAVLESLRIEKASFLSTEFGLNQVIMAVIGVGALLLMIFRKKHIPKLLLCLCLVATLTFSGCQSTSSTQSVQQVSMVPELMRLPDRKKVTLELKNKENPQLVQLQVEVVNSPASRTLGLGERTEIGSDGMLFVFAEKANHRFWMKGMKFDLDILWIEEGKVKGIESNVPHPKDGQELSTLPTYLPPEPVQMILELPAGAAAVKNIRVGDEVIVTNLH
jgi:phosphatidylglycerol---prolipoprotein diacylglyceryl transferase